MKINIIFCIIIFFESCCILENYHQKKSENNLSRINASIKIVICNFDNAKHIADSLFEYHCKNDMKEYYEKYSENDTSYIFQLFHNKVESKKPNSFIVVNGGGGEIAISKKNCKVISIIGYQ